MSSSWIAAFVLLALLSVSTALISIASLRQIGVLHQRLRPTGPGTYEGPALGQELPMLPFVAVSPQAPSLFKQSVTVFVYVTPGCSVCKTMPDIVRAYLRHLRASDDVEIVFATDVPEQAAIAYLGERDLPAPLFQSDTLSRAYELPGSPYTLAVRMVSADSVEVLSCGVTNTLEQFEDVVAHACAQRDVLNAPVDTASDALLVEMVPTTSARETNGRLAEAVGATERRDTQEPPAT